MEETFRNSLLLSTSTSTSTSASTSTSTSTSTSMPMPSLISRLDRLDSMMRHLEGKKERIGTRRRWASSGDIGPVEIDKEPVPLEWAVREAQSKGSISDRISSLENRLVQLFLSMESKEAASSSESAQTEQTSPEKTHSSGVVSRKDGLSHSFSRFWTSNHANKQSQQHCTHKLEVRETREHQHQHQHQRPKHNEESPGRTSTNLEEKASQKPKKIGPSRLHFRLLGC